MNARPLEASSNYHNLELASGLGRAGLQIRTILRDMRLVDLLQKPQSVGRIRWGAIASGSLSDASMLVALPMFARFALESTPSSQQQLQKILVRFATRRSSFGIGVNVWKRPAYTRTKFKYLT
jgi:hypothetical protein